MRSGRCCGTPHLYPVGDLVPMKRAVWCEARKVWVRVHVHRKQDLALYGSCSTLSRASPLQRLQPSAPAVFALCSTPNHGEITLWKTSTAGFVTHNGLRFSDVAGKPEAGCCACHHIANGCAAHC